MFPDCTLNFHNGLQKFLSVIYEGSPRGTFIVRNEAVFNADFKNKQVSLASSQGSLYETENTLSSLSKRKRGKGEGTGSWGSCRP